MEECVDVEGVWVQSKLIAKIMNIEKCKICGCEIHRDGDYAKPTVKGRSHATKHHYVAERFYGRTKNKRTYQEVSPIFGEKDFSEYEGQSGIFCYECHEELLHNPILLPADVEKLAKLVHERKCNEIKKGGSREKIAERIKLFHEIISLGLDEMMKR